MHISADVARPVARILAELGARLPDLPVSDAGVPADAADAMMALAARQLGDDVAIQVASQMPIGALGPVDYALSTSATLREGIAKLARFYGLATDRAELELLNGPTTGFALKRRAGVAHSRYWIEFSVAVILQRLRVGVGAPMIVAEVTFAHAAPIDKSSYESFFGAPVVFDAEADRLVVPPAVFDLPLRTAQPVLAEMLLKKLDEIQRTTSADPILARVIATIEASLGDPEISIDIIARRLATSSRSLQRHLSERSTSFRAIVDDLRCQRAHRLLEDQRLTPAEIARQLSFADVSAFFRAFRRWTGDTPGNVRARASSALARGSRSIARS